MCELKEYISPKAKLSKRKQCNLVGISRSCVYYYLVGESDENLRIMRLMDEHHIENPTYGIFQIQDFLFNEKQISTYYKRIRRLLQLMGIMAIYPKRNLSKLGLAKHTLLYTPFFIPQFSVS